MRAHPDPALWASASIGAAGRHGLGRPRQAPPRRRAPVVAEAAPLPEPPPRRRGRARGRPRGAGGARPRPSPPPAPTVSAGRPATDAAGVTVHRGLD